MLEGVLCRGMLLIRGEEMGLGNYMRDEIFDTARKHMKVALISPSAVDKRLARHM